MKKFILSLMALGLMLSLAACDSIPGVPSRGSTEPSEEPTSTPAAESDNAGNVGSPADDSAYILPDEDGYAYGFMEDTLRTAFFDFTVNSAYLCAEYEGYTAGEGNTLLVADVTFFNYTIYSQPMFDDDLQAQWSDEDDYTLAITEDYYPGYAAIEPVGDMFPREFDLGIQETRQGVLVFEVPAEEKDFSLSYKEYYEDGTYGDTFFVFFTPEVRTQQA